jgi:hypothetical protein
MYIYPKRTQKIKGEKKLNKWNRKKNTETKPKKRSSEQSSHTLGEKKKLRF